MCGGGYNIRPRSADVDSSNDDPVKSKRRERIERSRAASELTA